MFILTLFPISYLLDMRRTVKYIAVKEGGALNGLHITGVCCETRLPVIKRKQMVRIL